MNWVTYQQQQYDAYLSEKEAQARQNALAKEALEARRQTKHPNMLERVTHWVMGE